MSKIKIGCKGGGSLRTFDFGIYLDNEIIGILRLNETKEFEIPEGEHKLRAKWRFYGSKDYDFTLGKDHRSFIVRGSNSGIIFLTMFMFLITIAIRIWPDNWEKYPGIWAIIILSGTVYLIANMKNSFLKIKEEHW